MKILRYYDDLFQAQSDREFLASEGIPAEVLNENTGSAIPLTYANPSLRPYIAVPDDFYDQALELTQSQTAAREVCPDCGSADISYRLPQKYRAVSRFVVVPLMLFGIYGGKIGRVNCCNSCGREFRT